MQGLLIFSVALLSKLYWITGRSLSTKPQSYSDPKKIFVGLRDWKQQQSCSSLLTVYRSKKESEEDFCERIFAAICQIYHSMSFVEFQWYMSIAIKTMADTSFSDSVSSFCIAYVKPFFLYSKGHRLHSVK